MLVLSANLASVYALYTANGGIPAAAVCIPVLSRAAAGMLLLCVRTMPDSSLGAYFKTGNGPVVKAVLAVTGLAALAAAWIFSGGAYAAALAAGTVLGACLLYTSRCV